MLLPIPSIVAAAPLIACCWLISGASSRRHHLFVGNLNLPGAIRSIIFDDDSLQINVSRTTTADSSHSWIAFNHDMTHVYGASMDVPRLATYDVVNNSAVQLSGTVAAKGKCATKTAAYLIASKRFPHYVFSASYPGPNACGMTTYANPKGVLSDVAQTWNYGNKSGIHGLAFGWGLNQILYTADLMADAIWTHSFGAYGEVYFMGKYTVAPGLRPRHIVTHPFGKYLYAVMEGSNQLVPYVLDPYMGIVTRNESAYSLIPPGQNSSDYAASDLMFSRSSKYLWATVGARENASLPGYLSAFLLDDDGSIAKKMFTVSTTIPAGAPTTVSPAPWDDEWAATTDATSGFLQMWKMKGGKDTENGVVYATAEAQARLSTGDSGCCSNVIWYN